MIEETLTLEQRIEKALDGRTQTYIVKKLQEKGIKINDVQFTRKKKGISNFNEEEIKELKKLLKVNIVY